VNSPQIVGLGGYPDDAMLDHILGLARGRRLLYVPTAGAEDPSSTLSWYSRLHGRADLALKHLDEAAERHRNGHYMWDVARVARNTLSASTGK